MYVFTMWVKCGKDDEKMKESNVNTMEESVFVRLGEEVL